MGEVRVQDEQGNIHVFPDGSTPEMISQAMNLKPAGLSAESRASAVAPMPHRYSEDQFDDKRASYFPNENPKIDPSTGRILRRDMPGSFEGHPENVGEYVPATAGRAIEGGVDISRGNVAMGTHKLIQAGGNAIAPMTPILAAGAPLAFSRAVAGGYVGGKGAEAGAKIVGATPDQQQLAGDIGNLAGGSLGVKAPSMIKPSLRFAGNAASKVASKVEGAAADNPEIANAVLKLLEPRKNLVNLLKNAAKKGVAAAPETGGATLEETGVAETPKAEAAPLDRRQNSALREQVSKMSPDEMVKHIYVDKDLGIPNARAFDHMESVQPTKAKFFTDVSGLKALNDNVGIPAGDALLKAKAEALKEAGLNPFRSHASGDEFMGGGDSVAELHNKLEAARKIFQNKTFSAEVDGVVKHFKGGDFSHGSGETLADAEAAMRAHKAAREASGESARGEFRGIHEVSAPGESQANQVPQVDQLYGKTPTRSNLKAHQRQLENFKANASSLEPQVPTDYQNMSDLLRLTLQRRGITPPK